MVVISSFHRIYLIFLATFCGSLYAFFFFLLLPRSLFFFFCMSLPTFSELLASLHLSNAGEFETDSPANADVDCDVAHPALAVERPRASTPSPSPSPSPPVNLTTTTSRHTRCISSSSSSKHFPSSSSPSTIPDIVTTDLHSASSPLTDSEAGSSSSPSHARSTRHYGSTRSINRFTPYLSASKTVHIRRCSLPDDLQDAAKPELPDRPSTVSPRLLASDIQPQLGDSKLDANNVVTVDKPSSPPESPLPLLSPLPPLPPHSLPLASTKVMHVHVETHLDVPISTFARRNTPQSSPLLTNFRPKRRYSSLSPVSLPTLLPGLSTISLPDSESILCNTVDTKFVTPDNNGLRVVRQHGLRLSSYRSFYVSSTSRSRTAIGTSCL